MLIVILDAVFCRCYGSSWCWSIKNHIFHLVLGGMTVVLQNVSRFCLYSNMYICVQSFSCGFQYRMILY